MRSVLVLGCGSIGQRHLRNAATLGVAERLGFDPDPARRAEAAATGATMFDDLEAALAAGAEAVYVCTPPSSHVALALRALETGAHLFVEKPLSHTLADTDRLVEAASAAGRVCMVGYNLRFHRGIARLLALVASGEIGDVISVRAEFGQYLPDWRPTRDYRQGYNAHKSLGGGVLLDVSHEIDYLRALVGEIAHVFCFARNTGRLEVDTEDLAILLMRSPSDVPVELHLDCLQRTYSRTCKVIGSEGTVLWDYARGLDVYTVSERAWRHEPLTPDPNLMYLDQMAHFLACVRGEATPPVDAATARRVLAVVDAAKQSAARGVEFTVQGVSP
jgi:predicted dehydrogenase